MMISQQEILDHFLPILEKYGKRYKKFTLVKAKKADPGTWIITKTSDGFETKNQAKAGDMLVENQTSSLEQYLVNEDVFSKKYKIEQRLEQGWAIYKPFGEILAYRVSIVDFEFFGVLDILEFEAPWGESMIIKPGDYLVTPPEKNEMYRIAEKEFEETYKQI